MNCNWKAGLALCLAALTYAGAAQAQEATDLRCMTRPEKLPKYPQRDQEKGLSATFRVQMNFTRPDRAPEVNFLFLSGSQAMQDEVEAYAAGLRLPCLPPGRTISIVQDYSFKTKIAEAEVGEAVALRNNSSRHSELASCLRTAPRRISPMIDQQTGSMIKKKQSGNVLVQVRFMRGDGPPEVRVLYDSGPHSFTNDVLETLSEYRIPCMHEGDEPYEFQQQFSLNDGNQTDHAFNDAGLVSFLKAVKNVDAKHVNFQLDTMACPFKVVWKMYMPAMPNDVREVGRPNPNRAAFLNWLEGLSLNLGKETFEQLLGQSMVITVPCGSIEL
ncbi:MAG TPA: hypothetical protein VGM81_10545 [Burkholderiaceae bacterium]|jgi:hypothetical protein